MDRYAETKQIINDMASVKMAMNSHKGNIEGVVPSRIIKLMEGEVDELKEAIDSKNLMHILEEIADVQNFLIALAHRSITD